MTEHASGEININSKMSKVLEILLELDEYPSWIQDIISIDVHSRDSQGRAILATMKTNAMGRSIEQTHQYSYDNYPSEISWKFIKGDMVSSLIGSYKLEQLNNDEVKVIYNLDIDLTSSLPGFIKRKAAQKIVDSALKNLKQISEK
ncbi:MAG: SRPBCC family protein [Acidimicrobiia bacterium]|nr:SRPBCC family protein [Acidimicrobiia bacterium]